MKNNLNTLFDHWHIIMHNSIKSTIRNVYMNTTSVHTIDDMDKKSYFNISRHEINNGIMCDTILTNDIQEFIESNDPKTMLISCLVNQVQLNKIQNSLLEISKLINSYNHGNNLIGKIIISDSKPYFMINLFLTNNNNPQLIHLGFDIASSNYIRPKCHFSKNINYQLCTLVFLWHTTKPSQYYQPQIISLDDNIDFEQAMNQLDKIFNKRLRYEMYDEHGTLRPDNYYRNITNNYVSHKYYHGDTSSITILDFEWLMNHLDTHNILENKTDMRYQPQLKQILQYLSNELND